MNRFQRATFLNFLIFTAVLVSACFVLPHEVWARAGGGGSYGGGGGGGSGGSGGSGGGGGELIYLLFWLCWHHPLIGIPLAIAMGFLMYHGGDRVKQGHITQTIRRGRRHQQDRLRDQTLNKIQQTDPTFELPAFLGRVKTAFEKIQHAWSEQDLHEVRSFISDGIHERFTLQIAMQKSEGIRNVMERVAVHNLEVVALFANENFETIHVQVKASAVDYNANLKTGKRIGEKSTSTFTEYWSFHRRPGAESIQGDGAIEGNCPRCGSLLKIVDKAECQSCGAQVNSGEFDWVLAEITQEQEWNVPQNEYLIPGITELKENDRGLSIQHLEDRVSVMFWRLKSAEFYNDLSYAEPIATPEFCDSFRNGLNPKEFWKDPAVGKVEMMDVKTGDNNTPDRIRVKVRWSGSLLEKINRKRTRVLRGQAIFTHVYTLIRDHNVQSIADATFTSAGCSNCGAPINVNKAGECVYCGTVLNTGKHDWVLDDVSPYLAVHAYQQDLSIPLAAGNLTGGQLDAHADSGLSLAVLAKVMLIDGDFNEKERAAIYRLGARRGLSTERVDEYIQHASARSTNIPTPEDPRQASAYLEQLIHVVLADGQITRQEKTLLKKFADHVGLADADVKMAINRERKRSYQAARQELRHTGQST
ncbi:TIM44-like domain-containing protein [Thalassoglobus polymorphus]|uniref:Tim44-like domain protein n=1 Tax=Thalassoglobus polymorphus TaxID=2527994 RepID=A0A517QNI3_9PLAN|nr:TIM44-like domain-containing protein [Thalassoglobus polymorphus]QDT33193.1 Tim44-like domain protein [Thalassoglobus polymorphus]